MSSMSRAAFEAERASYVQSAEASRANNDFVALKFPAIKVLTLDQENRPQRELTASERNLLEVGFGKEVYFSQISMRFLHGSIQQTQNRATVEVWKTELAERVLKQRKTCKLMLRAINTRLIGVAGRPKSTVLYFKMKGDYLLFLAEVEQGPSRTNALHESLLAYSYAMCIAMDLMTKRAQIRFDLGRYFSTFITTTVDEREGRAVESVNFRKDGEREGCWVKFDESVAQKTEADYDWETLSFAGTSFSPDIVVECTPKFQDWSTILLEPWQ